MDVVLLVSWLYLSQLRKVGRIGADFRSWENRGRGGVFVAGETKSVAAAMFFVAEIGLMVSRSYLKQLRKSGLILTHFVSGEWRKRGQKSGRVGASP